MPDGFMRTDRFGAAPRGAGARKEVVVVVVEMWWMKGGTVPSKRCYALDKQQAVGQVSQSESKSESEIKPYADFILITEVPLLARPGVMAIRRSKAGSA